MTRSGALITGVLPLLMATAAFADSPAPPQISGTVQSPVILPGPIAPEITQQPLWTIGGLPVAIWAPVPPPYNMQVNRSAAADPFYDQPD
jgi:hypothetical protein